ncbi:hypothetical protein A1O1_00004 [Capronia coronata CBS 617.96]|uniref:Uncharacterized protein n=1 Tax=Capronia coronata CBS 617.96 TaxID=1182541 RepID=W9Z016_9EURO|nr:uncharacterized protein A1O1_00004 [Capronia coronata CBS 617.96]EXJ94886.1 hypothetical protein A1O1_00004 [Capronia coronata CBS 617.96]
MPRTYPSFPRSYPEIPRLEPHSIASEDMFATAKFINEKLSLLNHVEEHRTSIISSGQQWGRRSSEKMERRIWVQICPFVLLGSYYVFETVSAFERVIPSSQHQEQFAKKHRELIDFYKKWRFDSVSVETLAHYTHDRSSPSQRAPSKYTEMRACNSLNCYKNLRDVDKFNRPEKYMTYVMEAEKEWQMIKREKGRLDALGDTYAELWWSTDWIDQHLRFLDQAKIKLAPREQKEDADEATSG